MPLGEITDRVHRFLSLVGLPGIDGLLPAELSGGMRKRVGSRARSSWSRRWSSSTSPPPGSIRQCPSRRRADRRAARGVCDTAIVVTHDIEFAERIADRMAILHQGRFADVGTPAEIHRSTNPDVRKFLAGELRAS